MTHFLDCADQTQKALADLVGIPTPTLYTYLHQKRHPSIETVHRINAAMGRLLRSSNVSAYLEAIVAYSIRQSGGVDRDATAAVKHGLLLALGRIVPYLRDGNAGGAAIVQAWQEAGAPLALVYSVNKAFRRDIVRSIDGTVPRRLFVDEIASIFARRGIPLERWFKPESETRRHRALETVHFVTRTALARTGADVALRNELEATVMAAVLNLINLDSPFEFEAIRKGDPA